MNKIIREIEIGKITNENLSSKAIKLKYLMDRLDVKLFHYGVYFCIDGERLFTYDIPQSLVILNFTILKHYIYPSEVTREGIKYILNCEIDIAYILYN